MDRAGDAGGRARASAGEPVHRDEGAGGVKDPSNRGVCSRHLLELNLSPTFAKATLLRMLYNYSMTNATKSPRSKAGRTERVGAGRC
jgi:hypothetical protein